MIKSYVVGFMFGQDFIPEKSFDNFTDAITWVQEDLLGGFEYYNEVCLSLNIYTIREENVA